MKPEEILDMPTPSADDPGYLRKSAMVMKINIGLFVLSILISMLLRPISHSDLFDFLVGLPFLAVFVLAPMGLYYSWKSHTRKEGRRGTRLRYMFGHLFFCTMLMYVLLTVVLDILTILN